MRPVVELIQGNFDSLFGAVLNLSYGRPTVRKRTHRQLSVARFTRKTPVKENVIGALQRAPEWRFPCLPGRQTPQNPTMHGVQSIAFESPKGSTHIKHHRADAS